MTVLHRDLVVTADDGHVVKILKFLHGALRHEQRAFLRLEDETGAAVLSRPDQAAGVREFELNRQGAGGRIDRALDRIEASLVGVDGPIR